ncbi:MAG: polysaccharide pyruvyl transferase family protein [Proteobacteria bacterium]|nr:polysaccharide pyruvyl transferase family protein [Pseudomonadota bacterium]
MNNALSKIKYGLLSYSTANLGDEIQSIAARTHLPQVDFLVNRESLDFFNEQNGYDYRLILNGWFLHNPIRWPPAPLLNPLIISFHITNLSENISGLNLTPAQILLSDANLEYLHQHAPIGARDLHTLRLLEANKVDAYFSGCLTLTLPERAEQQVEDVVYLVDLDNEIVNHCMSKIDSEIRILSHIDNHTLDPLARLAKAEGILNKYQKAKAVVTSRLHAALPCLAMKVPVLLINCQTDQYRFEGLKNLVRNVNREQFLAGHYDFDFKYPTRNSDQYYLYRNLLLQKIAAFIDPTFAKSNISNKLVQESLLWARLAQQRLNDRTKENLASELSELKEKLAQSQELLTIAETNIANLRSLECSLQKQLITLQNENDQLKGLLKILNDIKEEKSLIKKLRYLYKFFG